MSLLHQKDRKSHGGCAQELAMFMALLQRNARPAAVELVVIRCEEVKKSHCRRNALSRGVHDAW